MGSSVDTAGALTLLSQPQQHGDVQCGARPRAGFECKTCGRRFLTFQALGGHRASHRRPRPRDVGGGPCLGRGQPLEAHAGKGGPRVHGCPVCGIEFAAGQALGGHMRRHRAAADVSAHGAGAAPTPAKVDDVGDDCTGGICLDLNLTPSENCAKCQNSGLRAAVQSVQRTLLSDCSL